MLNEIVPDLPCDRLVDMSQVSQRRLQSPERFLPQDTTPEELCAVCDEMIEEYESQGDIDTALRLREMIAAKLPSYEPFQDWLDKVYYESKGYVTNVLKEYIISLFD
jgi:hypothetical protein